MQLCFLSNMSSSDWAAWVQAIGSIAAIFCAFLLGRYQVESARKQALEKYQADDLDRKKSFAAIILNAETQAKNISDFVPPDPGYDLFPHLDSSLFTIEESFNALCAIPLHDVGSYEAVMCISGEIAAIKKIISTLAAFKKASFLACSDKSDPPNYLELHAEILTWYTIASSCSSNAIKIFGLDEDDMREKARVVFSNLSGHR